MSFCMNCGEQIPSNIKFCTNCGQSVQQNISDPSRNNNNPSAKVSHNGMIVVSSNRIDGHKIIDTKGPAFGVYSQAGGLKAVKDLSSMKNALTGRGELGVVTKIINDVRREAIGRMIEDARNQGGNAIISLRINWDLSEAAATIMAYGTVVVVEMI